MSGPFAPVRKQIVPGGTEWSRKFSYSRAIRVGNVIEVAGTVAVDEKGQVVGAGDLYTQSKYIFEKIIAGALAQVGASLKDVVRTRVLVVDKPGVDMADAGRAHGEVFKGVDPVNTTVYISKLVNPEFLVEIEVSAIVVEEVKPWPEPAV